MRRILLSLFGLLLAVPVSASITGVVVNSDGQAISAAKVSLCAPETIDARRARLMSKTPARPALVTTTSDSKGTFRFDTPKDHPVVDVAIEANGFVPETVRLLSDEDAGAIALVSAPMQRGTVTANGKPVAGATVVWVGATADSVATTDAEGHYTVPNPSRWANRLAIAHPDFAVHQEGLRNEVKNLDRTLNAGATISGHVVAADGKTPVAKATLLIDDLPVATSADDGSFTITHAPKDWQEVEAESGDLAGLRARTNGAITIRMGKVGKVTGVLRDAKTQTPLVHAEVRLGPEMPAGRMRGLGSGTGPMDVRSALTDAKGTFTLPVPPGRYNLTAIYPGSVVGNAAVAVAAGQTINRPLYAAARARVIGMVVDEQKHGVAGARIASVDASRGNPMMMMINPMRLQQSTAVSGPDGRFVLRNVGTDSTVKIEAEKKGSPPASSASLHFTAGETKSGILLTIPRGVAFTGRVTDGDGRPLSGVSVDPIESSSGGPGMNPRRIIRMAMRTAADDENTVQTGSDGAFSLRLKEGSYDVIFKRDGFAAKTLRAQNVSATTPPVTVKLDPGVEIRGRVVRGGTGVEGVNITATNMEAFSNTVTASDGTFTLTDLTPGQMMLSATKPDALIQQIRNVTAPVSDLVIDVPVGGRITGRVVDKSNNTPVASFQAGVSLVRGAGGFFFGAAPAMKPFTNDDGTFVLENVPPGPTELVVNAPGYTTAHVPGLNIEDGKTLSDVEVDLTAGARLAGRVTSTDGTPLSGATVRQDVMAGAGTGRVVRIGGPSPSVTTDPNGEYSIDSIDQGEKTFVFQHDGYVPESRTITISGKDARLDVQLSSGMTLSGTVVTDAGVPVADAAVTARSASDASFGRQAQTDAGGNFQIPAVAPGHYTISASKSGLTDGILRDFDASSGAPARVVMKSGGTIMGHVTGLTDAELQQAQVMANGTNASASAEVDGSGAFQINGAPTGTVRVSARTAGTLGGGKTSPVKSVQVDPGSSVQVDLEFKSSTVIRGRVTQNGQPVTNAMIRFTSLRGQASTNAGGTTDSNGAYEINGLDDGSYSVSVFDIQGSASYTSSYTVSGSATYDITIKTASVRGTVVDATTGEPVADAQIQIQPAGTAGPFAARTVSSDPSGSFVIDNVQSGSYQAVAQKEGYGHEMRNLVVSDTPPDDLQFKLSPSDGITLRVVDGRDNRMLSANVVRVLDAQGNPVEVSGFRFSATPEPVKLTLAPGRYTVTVTAMGYATQVLNVVSPSTQTVAMTPGGTLVLRSKSSSRQSVRLIMPNGSFYPRGPNGVFVLDPNPLTTTLENVAGGNYTLQILDGSGNVTNTVPVTVVEGQQNVIDV